MIAIDSYEAILFRMLVSFFGEDRVIPHMSVTAVCGGNAPELGYARGGDPDVDKCLFTIVNLNDDPRLVVEFELNFGGNIEPHEVSKRRYIQPALEAVGVSYLTISKDEFLDMTSPGSGVTLFSVLESKWEDCPQPLKVVSSDVDQVKS